MKTRGKSEALDRKRQAKAKLDELTRQTAQGIIDLITSDQAGSLKKPWDHPLGRLPFNPASGHRYTGKNFVILLLRMQAKGFEDPRWLTFHQAHKLGQGVHVARGEAATTILRPIIVKKDVEEPDPADEEAEIFDISAAEGETEDEGMRQVVYFKPYQVWNGAQIANMPKPEYPPRSWNKNEFLELLVRASGATVVHAVGGACFKHDRDIIQMPHPEAFESGERYSSILGHEWYHWTGLDMRENRLENSLYASPEYAREELRAEVFSAMLAAYLGLPTDLGQNAAYIASWQKRLEENPREIVQASVEASRMLEVVDDFAHGRQPKPDWFPPISSWPAECAALWASPPLGASPAQELLDWLLDSPELATTWFQSQRLDDGILFATDKHGNDRFLMPGPEDLREAERLASMIEASYPALAAQVETVDSEVRLLVSPRLIQQPEDDVSSLRM